MSKKVDNLKVQIELKVRDCKVIREALHMLAERHVLEHTVGSPGMERGMETLLLMGTFEQVLDTVKNHKS